jgi:hypothetical protein
MYAKKIVKIGDEMIDTSVLFDLVWNDPLRNVELWKKGGGVYVDIIYEV